VRDVHITPNDWAGDGLLGCDIGIGYLNRIPDRTIKDFKILVTDVGKSDKTIQYEMYDD
jgi:hypothetical protein